MKYFLLLLVIAAALQARSQNVDTASLYSGVGQHITFHTTSKNGSKKSPKPKSVWNRVTFVADTSGTFGISRSVEQKFTGTVFQPSIQAEPKKSFFREGEGYFFVPKWIQHTLPAIIGLFLFCYLLRKKSGVADRSSQVLGVIAGVGSALTIVMYGSMSLGKLLISIEPIETNNWLEVINACLGWEYRALKPDVEHYALRGIGAMAGFAVLMLICIGLFEAGKWIIFGNPEPDPEPETTDHNSEDDDDDDDEEDDDDDPIPDDFADKTISSVLSKQPA